MILRMTQYTELVNTVNHRLTSPVIVRKEQWISWSHPNESWI